MSENPQDARCSPDAECLRAMREKLHPHCFVCSPANPSGLAQVFHLEADGSVAGTFKGHQVLEGYPGLVHGGIIASLLDGAMTNCLFAHGVEALTADLRIRYREPVVLEGEVNMRAWLAESHGRLYSLRAELSQDGRVKVIAQGKFIERDAESPRYG